MLCVICKKKAKYKYSPDIDINSIGACAKHKQYVGVAYMILCENFEDKEANEYNKFIKAHKDYKK